MTNFDKWMSYTDRLPTPDNMIRWAWLYTVSAALQRRVWIGPEDKPLYPAMYIVFVSKPGIGKTLVIDDVEHFLRKWFFGENQKLIDSYFKEQKHKLTVSVLSDDEKDKATKHETQSQDKSSEVSKPYLFPIASDASTYEALVLAFGRCHRRIEYVKYDSEGNEGVGRYGHSSLAFILKEFGSLLRKRANDTVTFLLGLYDCPDDYDYETITRGRDRIKKACLNILAATNPSFMQECLDEKLVNEAFVSRIFFIFNSKNRKVVSRIAGLTPEQKQHGIDLENYILKLSTLYGNAWFEESTWEFIHNWWVEQETKPEVRASNSPKLDPFRSRMVLHLQKVAMALHFSESTEMLVSLETVKRAIEMINNEMKYMHLALLLESDDPTAKIVKKVTDSLRDTTRMNEVEIYMIVYQALGMVDKKKVEEALEFLSTTKQIKCDVEKDEATGDDVTWWRLA